MFYVVLQLTRHLSRTNNSWLFAPSSLILANHYLPLNGALYAKARLGFYGRIMLINKHFRLSNFKLFIVLTILCMFEYSAFSILSMPYEELERNSDRYHPIVAYLFFIPTSLFCGILIVIFLKFLFKKNKGLSLTDIGIVDNSSPFSLGVIPFENISSITSITNSYVKFYRFMKFKTPELNINLRRRKKDANWWESKGLKGRLAKKFHTYTIPTRGFKDNQEKIVEAIRNHVEGRNIKVNTMDIEQIEKNFKAKRK